MLFTAATRSRRCCSDIARPVKQLWFLTPHMDERAAGNQKTEMLPSHYLHEVLQSIREPKFIEILHNIYVSEHTIRHSRIVHDKVLIVVSIFDMIVISINSWHYTSPLDGESLLQWFESTWVRSVRAVPWTIFCHIVVQNINNSLCVWGTKFSGVFVVRVTTYVLCNYMWRIWYGTPSDGSILCMRSHIAEKWY